MAVTEQDVLVKIGNRITARGILEEPSLNIIHANISIHGTKKKDRDEFINHIKEWLGICAFLPTRDANVEWIKFPVWLTDKVSGADSTAASLRRSFNSYQASLGRMDISDKHFGRVMRQLKFRFRKGHHCGWCGYRVYIAKQKPNNTGEQGQ